jgi:hypothetical protein
VIPLRISSAHESPLRARLARRAPV